MRLDGQLPDHGPEAPVRPDHSERIWLLIFFAFALLGLIWSGVHWMNAPPAADPSLANAAARSNPIEFIEPDDHPKAAQRRGEEGLVGISFTITARGRVQDCKVSISSGSESLNQQTCKSVEKGARYTPARDSEGRPIEVERTLRFRWQLEG